MPRYILKVLYTMTSCRWIRCWYCLLRKRKAAKVVMWREPVKGQYSTPTLCFLRFWTAESSALLEKFSRISLFEVVNGSPNKVLSILPIHIVHRSSLIPFVCEKRFTTINLLLPPERHSPINVYLYPTGRKVQILISIGCVNTVQWRQAWIVV